MAYTTVLYKAIIPVGSTWAAFAGAVEGGDAAARLMGLTRLKVPAGLKGTAGLKGAAGIV